jgi:hypothetical protein
VEQQSHITLGSIPLRPVVTGILHWFSSIPVLYFVRIRLGSITTCPRRLDPRVAASKRAISSSILAGKFAFRSSRGLGPAHGNLFVLAGTCELACLAPSFASRCATTTRHENAFAVLANGMLDGLFGVVCVLGGPVLASIADTVFNIDDE